MDKPKLKYLVVAGITSGILLSHYANSKEMTSDFMKLVAETGGNVTYRLMTEDELMLELNEEGAKIYRSLSSDGKELALREASRSCNGTNECAGLNACATDKNKCAGQGSCAGLSKCAFSDKNLAVKIVARKMAEKRENAQNHR